MIVFEMWISICKEKNYFKIALCFLYVYCN